MNIDREILKEQPELLGEGELDVSRLGPSTTFRGPDVGGVPAVDCRGSTKLLWLM